MVQVGRIIEDGDRHRRYQLRSERYHPGAAVPGDAHATSGVSVTGHHAPYQIFTSYGFKDAWTLRYHHKQGLTCCQEEDLGNRRSELEERIDMIFSLQRPLRVLDMELLGNKKRDKTAPPPKGGLWPSDHAALAATLMFKPVTFASRVGSRD